MRKIIFIFLLATSALKADSTFVKDTQALKKAGTSFAVSKTFELISLGVTAGALLSQDHYERKSLLILSGMMQLASITFFYRGCSMMIKANGIVVTF